MASTHVNMNTRKYLQYISFMPAFLCNVPSSMSRHNRRVPTSFYYQFAKDCRAFASKFSGGKFVSVLEGGYSDRALISGAMAHLIGLVDDKKLRSDIDKGWWGIKNLSLVSTVGYQFL